MGILSLLNSAPMYAICGGIIAFVAAVCIVFMVRAYRAGIAMGMDPVKLKRAITSSATFSVLPSVGILLGVIALSGSLGTPWPWLRLSVIGALHYETQVAQAAAEAVGIGGLSAADMTGSVHNDPYCLIDDKIKTVTNNHGGIIGGLTSGMPIIFRAAFKPTPSIGLPQRSVDLDSLEETRLEVRGRHDPCIAVRAVPCVEAAAAVTVLDIVLGK